MKGIKSLLSDNTKFIPLNSDQNKWLNYIADLQKQLKEHFTTLQKDNKITKYDFKCIFPIGTRNGNFLWLT